VSGTVVYQFRLPDRYPVLALVAVWLLLGLTVVSLGHAHEAGRLPHRLTFAAVSVARSVGGSFVWEATNGILPAPVAAGIGLGLWTGATWVGNGLAYRGPLDCLLDCVGGPDG